MSSYNFDIKRQVLTLYGKSYPLQSLADGSLSLPGKGTLAIDSLSEFLIEWGNDSPSMTIRTSGSTGRPKEIRVRKTQMMESARMTCDFLHLKPGDTTLLCMSLQYIGARMMVVRALVAGLDLWITEACGHPLLVFKRGFQFAAMVPLQVSNSLDTPEERKLLAKTEILIIGGGAIHPGLEEELKELPNVIYSTYGMTETVSHIALRRINGAEASVAYHPLPLVHLSVTPEQTLQIDAPYISDKSVITNDIVEINPDGSFTITGRKDNVINSGGIKVQIETIEKKLRPLLTTPFAITSIPDQKLGEKVALLIEGDMDSISQEEINKLLSPYEAPKEILTVAQIPQTGNGKTDRHACKQLATEKNQMRIK